MRPIEKVDLIHRLATTIYQALADAPETLTGPTACPAWDVGTTVAHLTGGAMRQCESMRRGRNGQGGSPDGNTTVTTPDQVQQRNAVSNPKLREELGENLLQRFHDEYATLDELLRSWTDWTIGCWHHRRGTMSAASYLDLRIQELVIHDWDMRSGGTGQAALDPEGVAALLPASEMWYGLCFRPTARLPQPVVYRFDIGKAGNSLQHDVSIRGDQFTLDAPDDTRLPDFTLTCSAETYLLCLYGRVDWVTAEQDGRLRVKVVGTQASAQDLTWFRERFGGL